MKPLFTHFVELFQAIQQSTNVSRRWKTEDEFYIKKINPLNIEENETPGNTDRKQLLALEGIFLYSFKAKRNVKYIYTMYILFIFLF